MPFQRSAMARRGHIGREHRKNCHRITIASSDGSRAPPKLGYRVAPAQGGLVMAHDTSAVLQPTAALATWSTTWYHWPGATGSIPWGRAVSASQASTSALC